MYVMMECQLSNLVKLFDALLLLAPKIVTKMLWDIKDGINLQYSGLAE